MSDKYGTLKRYIKEIAVSPHVFSAAVVTDVLEVKEVTQGITSISRGVELNLRNALMKAARQKFNPTTRQFDNQTYEQINEIVDNIVEQVVANITSVVQEAWHDGNEQFDETMRNKQ